MAKKEREIKVHFTFAMAKFTSARHPSLWISHLISSTSVSYNASFWLHFVMTAGKAWYPRTSLKNSKIPKLNWQTYQGKCLLD